MVIKHEIPLFCVFAHKNGGNREIDGKAKTLAKGTTRCLNNGWSQPFHSVISPLYMSIELFYVLRNGKDCINFLDKIPFLSRGLQLSQVKKKMMLQTFLFETLFWTSVFLLFFFLFQHESFDFKIKSFENTINVFWFSNQVIWFSCFQMSFCWNVILRTVTHLFDIYCIDMITLDW